jgi:hypothetical protein
MISYGRRGNSVTSLHDIKAMEVCGPPGDPTVGSRRGLGVEATSAASVPVTSRRPLVTPVAPVDAALLVFRMLGYPRECFECIDRARTIDAVSGVSAREPGAGEVLP